MANGTNSKFFLFDIDKFKIIHVNILKSYWYLKKCDFFNYEQMV